ncbi:hypothetical protein Fmac_016570 [Flemingia macrophylla]|uniref:Calcium-transporting ATPase n=1 Tax=Flemingia macrophylla TaxID=520843 RepID=A0ABD1MIG9_9FABA
MSMTLRTNLKRIDVFHNEPKTVVAPIIRWHSAFVAIYCSRALISHVTPNNTNKTKPNALPKPTPTPSFTVVDSNPHHSFGVDQTTLTDIVKEKDLESLENFGGVEGIATALETHVEYGIEGGGDDDSAEDIKRRKQMFGANTYAKPPFFHFVMEAFKNVTILILLAFAALSLGFGIKQHGPKEGWYDGGSIFLAVFIVISLSSISNFRQNRQFGKLSRVSKDIKIDVVKSGRRQHVSIFDIVVGDVICLKIGDQVPADGLFIEGHSLKVDESNLTLNNVVEIDRPQNPFLFSGAKVVDGYAKMLVTSVGMNTTWGQMMSSISSDIDEETPLQERLKRLTSSIKMVGLAVDFLVLIALLVRYFTGNTKDENGVRDFNGSKTKFDNIINSVVEIVADGLTSFVASIPEGLKLAATLTLADSMKKMIADRAMVRKLSACETMGFVTTICTDKTAILTLNEMKVTKFWLGLEPVEESAYSRVAPLLVLQLIREGVALNTAGSVHKSGSDEVQFSDSPIEKAILSWPVLDMSMEMEHVKRSCSIIHAETFNSEKKISGVLLRRKLDNTVNAHWKGAAEMILEMSSRYYDASGIVTGLDNDSKLKFEHIIQGIAASSNRCIAFAHVEVAEEEVGDEQGNTMVKVKENGLTLLGLVEIKNPCRPEVKEAVEACQHAGVNVKMITSDNVSTAKVIAAECGILRPNQDIDGAVIEGEQFRKYTPKRCWRMWIKSV